MHIAQIRVSQTISTVVLVVGVGWSGRVAAQCMRDVDCKGDRVCNNGVCVSPLEAAQPAVVPAPYAGPQPDTVPTEPAYAPPPQSACYPACGPGYLCNQGACVSACNPPCGPGQICAAGGQCVQIQAPPSLGVADSGWARGAGIFGYIDGAVGMGFIIGAAANYHHKIPAIPLGATGIVVIGVGVPIVAAGGASARNHPEVNGLFGLRVASWIAYGVFLADAVITISLGASGHADPGEAGVLSIGALGLVSAIGMAIDATVSASQADSVAERQRTGNVSKVEWSPFLAPVPRLSPINSGGPSQGAIAGLAGRF